MTCLRDRAGRGRRRRSRCRTRTEFTTAGLLTGRFVLQPPDRPDASARRAVFSRLLEALEAEPSVPAASLASALPGKAGIVVPAGPTVPEVDEDRLLPARSRSVDPGFCALLGASPVGGRLFSDADDATSEPVPIVNEAFVERHGLGGDAPGGRIAVASLDPLLPLASGPVRSRGSTS